MRILLLTSLLTFGQIDQSAVENQIIFKFKIS